MRKPLPLLAAAIVLALTLSANAAIFVHIEGLKGEATAIGHAGAIPALRFNLELSAPAELGSGGGGGTGKVLYKPLVITKDIDATTPQLLHALTTHEFFKSVTLELAKANSQGQEFVYYTLKLHNVVISDIHQYTDETTKANLEDISISYSALEVEGAPTASPPPKSPDTPVFKFPSLRPPNK